MKYAVISAASRATYVANCAACRATRAAISAAVLCENGDGSDDFSFPSALSATSGGIAFNGSIPLICSASALRCRVVSADCNQSFGPIAASAASWSFSAFAFSTNSVPRCSVCSTNLFQSSFSDLGNVSLCSACPFLNASMFSSISSSWSRPFVSPSFISVRRVWCSSASVIICSIFSA